MLGTALETVGSMNTHMEVNYHPYLDLLYLLGTFARNILKVPLNLHHTSVRYLLLSPFYRRDNSLRKVWDHTVGT